MEILLGIYVLLRIGGDIAYQAVAGLFHRPPGLNYIRNILYSLVRAAQHHDSKRKLRATKTTEEAYFQFVKSHRKVSARKQDLAKGAKLVWFGDQNPQKVLYYLHGGGYIEPPVKGHFVVMQRLAEEAKKRGIALGVAMLAYDLAPKGQYPRQLEQAAVGLQYLLNDLHFKPSDISIAGDSAGGNLTLALVSHIMHPHPSVEPITLDSHLAGVFPLSPWVTDAFTAPSVTSNAKKDYIDVSSLKIASAEYMGSSEPDNYRWQLDADSEWWRDIPARSLAVLSGSLEIFVDDIKTIAEKMKKTNPNLRYVEMPNEVHIQMAFDATIGVKATVSEGVLTDWVLSAAQA